MNKKDFIFKLSICPHTSIFNFQNCKGGLPPIASFEIRVWWKYTFSAVTET